MTCPKPLRRFQFEHPAFGEPGARFELSDVREPVFMRRLGQVAAAWSIDRLPGILDIAPNSPDRHMLRLVSRALRFVPAISRGDAVPTEILDCAPSWEPTDDHVIRALSRVLAVTGAAGEGRDRPAAITMGSRADGNDPNGVASIMLAGLVEKIRTHPRGPAIILPQDDVMSVIRDIARTDVLCRQIIAVQQMLGRFVKLTHDLELRRSSDAPTSAVAALRNPIKWATAEALALDARASDPLSAFCRLKSFRTDMWRRIARLRAFVLDFDRTAKGLSALLDMPQGQTKNAVGDLSRNIVVRYVNFDPSWYTTHAAELPEADLASLGVA